MSRPRQFDLIAFDWDGTLFDSTKIITRCIQDPSVEWVFASNEGAEGAEGGGEGATATA